MEEIMNVIEQLRTVHKPLVKGTKEADDVLNKVKDLLNQDNKQNWLGMCLLSCVVKAIDREIFEDNALIWLKSTMRIVNLIPSENLLGLCYETLMEILTKGHQIDKISREIATKAIEPLLALLLNNSLPTIQLVYKVIASCLKCYGGSCSKQRTKLELFILKGAVSRKKDITSSACSAFPYLALCGSGGDNHSKHVDNWKAMFDRTMKTIYTNYADLLNSNEIEPTKSDSLLSFPRYDKDCLYKDFFFLHIERSLQILTSLLSKSMVFNINLPLPLCVTLFTEISTLLTLDLKVHNFYSNIDVEVALINIITSFLDCMVTVFKQFSLLFAPYTKALSKIVVDSLFSPFVVDRTNSYCAFSCLVKHVSVSPLNCSMFGNVLDSLLKDISLDVTSTQVTAVPNNKKSKSKKRSLQEVLYSEDIDKTAAGLKWQNCCGLSEKNTKAALICLEDVVAYTGPLLPTSLVQLILSHMFGVCKSIYGNNSNTEGQYSAEIRYLIFKVLNALFMLYHPTVQVSRQILLSLFQTGTSDSSDKVAAFCKQSLYFFEQVLHNASPEFRTNAKLFGIESEEFGKGDVEMDILEDRNSFATTTNTVVTLSDNTVEVDSPTTSGKHQHSVVNNTFDFSPRPSDVKFQPTLPVIQHTKPDDSEIKATTLKITTTIIANDITMSSSEKQIKSNSADHVLLQKQQSPIPGGPRRNSDPGSLDTMTTTTHQQNTNSDNIVVVSDDEDQNSENPLLQSPAKKRLRQQQQQQTDSSDVDFELLNNNANSTKMVCIDDQPSSSKSNNNNNDNHISVKVNGGETMMAQEEDEEFQDIISTFQEVYAE